MGHKRKRLHAWLKALGANNLPAEIVAAEASYRLDATLKHDFFAATGLYLLTAAPPGPVDGQAAPPKVILKVGRTARLFGLPLRWLGGWLTRREACHYEGTHDLPGVPRYLGLWQRQGLIHEYIEGHPMRRNEWVNDEFFGRLTTLIEAMHGRHMAYVDLEKSENILVGDDGCPYLIDFQISYGLKARGKRPCWLGRFLLRRLIRSDRYHLAKHHRRHRPDQLTPEQLEASYRAPIWIDLHRIVFRPWTLLRRRALTKITDGEFTPRQEERRALARLSAMLGRRPR